MHPFTGDSQVVELVGTLRFEEFEGGFWALELDAAIDGLVERVELSGYEPDAGIVDGMRLRVRARTQPDAIGFRMAGPQVDVIDASPA
ncbi:MAG: hypothetical protein JWL76_680 [Thermoleophilia bacterium]|nr:hypothetical protein [Thermoleophilia bacterium]